VGAAVVAAYVAEEAAESVARWAQVPDRGALGTILTLLLESRAHLCTSLTNTGDIYSCVTWLIHMCDMKETWLLHVRMMTHVRVRRDSFIRVTWLEYGCDMTHPYVWHHSCICVTRLIHTCDLTHVYVRYNSFISVTWLMYMCDATHSYVWLDSCICVTRFIHTCDCLIRDLTHSYAWNDSVIHAA